MLDKNAEALDDSNLAIQLNRSFVKAYFRKASALTKLGEHRKSYKAWMDAAGSCEETTWLTKQCKEAENAWVKLHLKTEAVESTEDFIERYSLLSDTRLKLSTLAHFWYISGFLVVMLDLII